MINRHILAMQLAAMQQDEVLFVSLENNTEQDILDRIQTVVIKVGGEDLLQEPLIAAVKKPKPWIKQRGSKKVHDWQK